MGLRAFSALLSISYFFSMGASAEELDPQWFDDLPAFFQADGISGPSGFSKELDRMLSVENACTPTLETKKPEACPLPGGSTACTAFLDQRCELGGVGSFIRGLWGETFEIGGKKVQMGHYIDHPPSDLKSYCRNYNAFDRREKERFWVWFFSRLAFHESTCNTMRSKNPALAGVFQLESDNSLRSSSWRPKVCGNAFIKKRYGAGAKITDIQPNTHCAMAILAHQLLDPTHPSAIRGLSFGTLFSKKSHWEPLRKSPLANDVRLYRACGNG